MSLSWHLSYLLPDGDVKSNDKVRKSPSDDKRSLGTIQPASKDRRNPPILLGLSLQSTMLPAKNDPERFPRPHLLLLLRPPFSSTRGFSFRDLRTSGHQQEGRIDFMLSLLPPLVI